MTDYKKWDKIAAEASSDEDERPQPNVTRLDRPSRVTIGGQNGGILIDSTAGGKTVSPPTTAAASAAVRGGTVDYGKWDKMAQDVSDSEGEEEREDDGWEEEEGQGLEGGGGVYKVDEAATLASGPGGQAKSSNRFEELPDDDKVAAPALSAQEKRQQAMVKNGGITQTHVWSQDKAHVVVGVFVPAGTRAKDVGVTLKLGVLKMTGLDKNLVITLKGNKEPWLNKKLEYPVAFDDEDGLDYELQDYDAERRVVKVTLEKRIPGTSNTGALQVQSSVVLWWKRVFEGDEAIDVSKISDRPANREANANAWREAHEQFREMIKNQKPMEID